MKFKMPLAYNAEADRKSWEEMKGFLNALFKKGQRRSQVGPMV